MNAATPVATPLWRRLETARLRHLGRCGGAPEVYAAMLHALADGIGEQQQRPDGPRDPQALERWLRQEAERAAQLR